MYMPKQKSDKLNAHRSFEFTLALTNGNLAVELS